MLRMEGVISDTRASVKKRSILFRPSPCRERRSLDFGDRPYPSRT